MRPDGFSSAKAPYSRSSRNAAAASSSRNMVLAAMPFPAHAHTEIVQALIATNWTGQLLKAVLAGAHYLGTAGARPVDPVFRETRRDTLGGGEDPLALHALQLA